MSPSLPPFRLYSPQTGPVPLVPIRLGDGVEIWCKLEFLNPSGSTKDRIASFILAKAWRDGSVQRGSMVVEASSGSTSIAMAMVCAQLGLRFTAVMPEGVSDERLLIIRSFGGDVVFSAAEEGILGALRGAEELAGRSGAFFPRQFENPDNVSAHRLRTAREIVVSIPGGTPDAVVSGVGTGGTLVGLYHGFRDHGCRTLPVVARPVSTPATFRDVECSSFSARIPGVVEGMSRLFRPDELEGLVEIEVDDGTALDCTRQLIRRGFPVGPSSGLNYAAAQKAAASLDAEARVVTVFPDRMERYFSTELFGAVRSR